MWNVLKVFSILLFLAFPTFFFFFIYASIIQNRRRKTQYRIEFIEYQEKCLKLEREADEFIRYPPQQWMVDYTPTIMALQGGVYTWEDLIKELKKKHPVSWQTKAREEANRTKKEGLLKVRRDYETKKMKIRDTYTALGWLIEKWNEIDNKK